MDVEFIAAIDRVPAMDWDALHDGSYPFVRHAFLQALEVSGAVNAEKGWQPHHLIARHDGEIVAVMPLYLKTHSYGEYVFDWAWADAYQRYGRRYYPKLLSAIPFTPATGPRLLVSSSIDSSAVMGELAAALRDEVHAQAASSLHILFSSQKVSEQWQQQRMMQRCGPQYHWFDDDYGDFDGFLSSFSSRKRKAVRKERRVVEEQGLTLEVRRGKDISSTDWRFFFHCYQLTYAKRSGHGGYLPEAFFTRLAVAMPETMVMVIAFDGEQPVAAALNFRGGKTLYGRYWGCVREYEFLHFEACYYQGIDYCLREGLTHFDPGAQGEHKIQRGFTPIMTYSNHWLVDPAFSDAVQRFVDDEAEHIAEYLEQAAEALPFRRGE